jgi:hypothetical protein
VWRLIDLRVIAGRSLFAPPAQLRHSNIVFSTFDSSCTAHPCIVLVASCRLPQGDLLPLVWRRHRDIWSSVRQAHSNLVFSSRYPASLLVGDCETEKRANMHDYRILCSNSPCDDRIIFRLLSPGGDYANRDYLTRP